jgi:hypothetical protein
MHIIIRIVRTVGFLSVVLPHARNPKCYASRFPPVPETMKEYIWTGISTLKGFGGCNDLILRFVQCFNSCKALYAVTTNVLTQ